MPRILNEKQTREFFDIIGDPPKFDTDCFVKLFAYTKKNGIRFHPDDVIKIGPEQSKFVKQNSETNLGIYIFNKFMIEELECFGYINHELNGKFLGKIRSAMSKALRNGDITPQQFATYIDKYQYLFGGNLAHIINTSLSSTVLTLPPSAKKLRSELFKQYEKELAANDPEVSAMIENKVVDEALKEMRKTGDPSLAIYDAGSGVDPYNNYRTMFVMKGAIVDNTGESPTGYKIVKSNYDDGITKEDMPIIADSLVRSAYMRGVATQDSGFETKTYNTINQRIHLQPKGSFCGTKDTEPVEITENNKDNYIYRYIKTSAEKPVLLTDENINSYVGKVVHMYTPLHCKAKDPEYCNICVGDRPFIIGIRNVGLTFSVITGATMNAALKVMHKTKVEIYNITVDDITKYMDRPLI